MCQSFKFICRFQLKVVSEASTKETINNVAFQDLTLTDFYVIIADDFENVRIFHLNAITYLLCN